MGSKTKTSKECPCQDPYAELPADLRPTTGDKMSGLRKVVCPRCEQEYWTNRDRDECIGCEQQAAAIG